MNKLIAIVSGLCLALFATAALAVPVNYTVSGVVFDDGGTLSGSFTYDLDTNTYSAINLVSTVGGANPGQTYVAINTAGPYSDSDSLNVVTSAGNGSGQPVMNLLWGVPLTNAGGVVGVDVNSGEGYCNVTCTGFGGPAPRFVVPGGTITGVPAPTIPTMSEWGLILMGVALAGMATVFVRRRYAVA